MTTAATTESTMMGKIIATARAITRELTVDIAAAFVTMATTTIATTGMAITAMATAMATIGQTGQPANLRQLLGVARRLARSSAGSQVAARARPLGRQWVVSAA